MKKASLATTLACAVGLGAAFTAAAHAESGHFTLPACYVGAQRIPFHYHQDRAADIMTAYSIANKDGSEPMVIFGNKFIALPPLEREFVAHHECAHHRKGHMSVMIAAAVSGKPLAPDVKMGLELEADCEAARAMKEKYGDSFGPEKLRESMAIAGKEPVPADRSHPDGTTRINRALECIL